MAEILQYQGSHVWNKVPEAIANSQNLFIFKVNVKKQYLEIQTKIWIQCITES